MMLIKYLKVLHAFIMAFWILSIKFPRQSPEQKFLEIQNWSRQMLRVLSIDLESAAQSTQCLTTQPRLLVANHVSWLDALVIQAVQPSVFVAKLEVKNWPIVGRIATACGVIYVKRGSPISSKRMVNDVAQALRNGSCVAGFPEGTSTAGATVNHFHANIFEAAIENVIAVQPVALRYTHPITGDHCTKAAFIGEIGFLQSLHQVISANGIVAKISMGELLSPQGHTRRSLAQLSHRTISAQLTSLSA